MKSRIPTILVIFIITSALVASVFAIHQIQNLGSKAEGDEIPQDVRITNIQDTSLSISWITLKPTIGIVEYTGPNGQSFEAGDSNLTTTHFVFIPNLSPNTAYKFKINGNGEWKAETSVSKKPNVAKIISGQVINANKLPAKNALVYVDLPTGETLSTKVSASGNWILSLPNVADATILNIVIETPGGITTAKVYLKSANPTPIITLGKSEDFIENLVPPISDTPKVDIVLP
jgi:hypothetical protein